MYVLSKVRNRSMDTLTLMRYCLRFCRNVLIREDAPKSGGAAEVQGNYQDIHHLIETKIGNSSEPNAVHTLSKTTTLNI